MIKTSDDVVAANRNKQARVSAVITIVAIASIVGLGLAWRNSIELRQAQESFRGQVRIAEQNNIQQATVLEQRLNEVNATTARLLRDLGIVEKRLQVIEGNQNRAREQESQVQEEYAQKLDQMDLDVKSELATKATNNDLKSVDSKVGNVKSDLDQTKNDLSMTRSELGTLIARNHEEIDVLRRMGERDYVEFSIQGRNKPQILGNIIVELRSVNTKKNTFAVALTVDDIRTENMGRTINEPVIFYPRGSHQADEFVVNSVAKDKIVGYLSMPKNHRAASASTNSSRTAK